MKNLIRAVVLALALALALMGCAVGDSTAGAAEICIDPRTGIRYDDMACISPYTSPVPLAWVYIMPGQVIPAYGWPVGHWSTHRPAVYTQNVPASGGVYSRPRNKSTAPVYKTSSAATQPPKVSTWQRMKGSDQQTSKSPQKSTWKPVPAANGGAYKPSRTTTYNKPPSYTTYKPPTTTSYGRR